MTVEQAEQKLHEALTAAFDAGFMARQSMVALSANPFDSTVLRQQWALGWKLSSRQIRDRRQQQRNADRIDGYDRDDLGESQDF